MALAALTLLILSEITVRLLSSYVPGLPAGIPTAWEVSSYLMGIAFMAGSAMTLRAGGHIRVAVLMAQLPPHGRRLLDLASSLLGFALTGFLVYSLVWFTWSSFDRGQTSPSSDIPLWIPEAAITFGAATLCLQMLARTIHAALGLPLDDERLKIAGPGE
ncbi:MAG: TRAP transporter small permease [Hyphomicrobiaceae bacterium]